MIDTTAISFLRETLKIEDAGLMEFFEDLRILQRSGTTTRDDVETLYKHIELNIGIQQSKFRQV
jgi:hypothetical protein